MDRLTLYGSFTSSSSYKPMLYLALARLPFSFRTVNLKTGVQNTPEYLAINRWGVVPSLRHRGLTIMQSNVILDYLARETGQLEGRTEQQMWQAREWLSWEADHVTYVAKAKMHRLSGSIERIVNSRGKRSGPAFRRADRRRSPGRGHFVPRLC
jgi:glutathione S-transferase